MLRKAKRLTEVTNPISGRSENLLSAKSWLQGILGVGFLAIIITGGLFLGGTALKKVGVIGREYGAKKVY